jgi:hypothetical protein
MAVAAQAGSGDAAAAAAAGPRVAAAVMEGLGSVAVRTARLAAVDLEEAVAI